MSPLGPEAEARIAQLDEEILALRRLRDGMLISCAALVEQLSDAHREIESSGILAAALQAYCDRSDRAYRNAEARRAFLAEVAK